MASFPSGTVPTVAASGWVAIGARTKWLHAATQDQVHGRGMHLTPTETWLLFGLAFEMNVFAFCAMYYRRIWHVRLRLWAVPFSLGALLFAQRLPPPFERRG